jgi:hypothetical protein
MPLNKLPDGTYVFDYTTLSTYSLCKRKGRNRFHLDLETPTPPANVGYGVAFHAGLAAHYAGGNWSDVQMAAVLAGQQYNIPMSLEDDPAKSLEACLQGLRRYIVFYAGEPYRVMRTPDGKPMVELTHRFMLSKDPPIAYAMKIDAMVEHTIHGTVHPMDHKTTGQIHNYTQTIRPNHQFTGYLAYAVEMYGERARSAIMNVIYAASELKTKQRPLADWFARAETERSEEDFEEWSQTMRIEAMDFIDRVENDKFFPMNAPFACHVYNGCSFRDLCSQHDDPVVRDGLYVKRPWGLLGVEE